MKIIEKIKEKWNHRKWTMYLYYNSIRIKKVKINENAAPKTLTLPINVYFKKQLFKSNMVNVIVSPAVLLYSDEKNRVISIGVVIEQGTRL